MSVITGPGDAIRCKPCQAGRMLTLCLKKFSGSYFVLISLSRGRFGPYATAAASAGIVFEVIHVARRRKKRRE